MKPLFWTGIVLVVLGLVSLVVPTSRTQRDGINAGGMSMTVETQHSEKAPAMVSVVLILAGAGMIFAVCCAGMRAPALAAFISLQLLGDQLLAWR